MANRNVNQRITADIVPMEEDETEDHGDVEFHVPALKRNLLGEFGRPSLIEPPLSEHMKVYLRIRPFSDDEKKKNESQGCLSVESTRIVATHAPKDSHYFKNTSRGIGKTTTKFTFSQIFKETTTQKEFFNETMLGLVKDFIDGQNCLVFSYGVTSSGKTYTIQGEPKDAGVLPRALDVLFNSISGRQWDGMNLKPDMFTNVTRLTAEQEAVERKMKERVLKLSCDDDMDVMSLLGDDASDISVATNTTTCSESSNISTMESKDSLDGVPLFDGLAERVREEAKVSVEDQGQIKFSVWVSFAEIYNEQIYDLLEPLPKKKNVRRTCLKVSDDQSGSPYIKGLKCINVNTADEAYKLLTIGQRNLQTACTKLNHNSSRSHCIFNIKILRVVDKEDPHVARVSMLTLCDLAGSERCGKTHNTGDRLKEAGNINTSLLTLGRCIETLKYNQHHKDHTRIIPFRESKLTRLFQNYFVGRGKAAMFVNVNQCASMFDETQHVFKFSAIASQVVVQQKPVFIRPKLPVVKAMVPIPRTSISWATPARGKIAKQQEAENIPLPEDDTDEDLDEEPAIYTQDNIDELLGIIEQLQDTCDTEMKSKAKLESHIRKEVCDEMMKQFIEIETQCEEQIRIREQMAEDLAEKRMQILIEAERAKNKKRDAMTDDDDEWVSSVVLHQEQVKVQKKDEEIRALTDRVQQLSNQNTGDRQDQDQSTDNAQEISSLREQLDSVNGRVCEMTESNDKLTKERDNLRVQLTSLEDKLQASEIDKDNKTSTQLEELLVKVADYEGKIATLETELAKRPSDDGSKADLIENLTQQLQQSREHIKDQETEISELNDMLTEAGDTFQQKEQEICKLQELIKEYETKMDTQNEAIKVLERAAADGRVAMETADQSLSKREDCVTSLQSNIIELEGDVNKYRNKARFFEAQIVEKEEESVQWKNKYDQGQDEHLKNQEALIHGFTAEITNLKSQIFHFKSQLYGVKSPTKSPGGSLKSPSVKMKLFSILSPSSKSPGKDKDLNASGYIQSPIVKSAMESGNVKHDVNEQVKAIQGELDKNCAMIASLEHALQKSKSAVEDLEKKLQIETENHANARNKIDELEQIKSNNKGGGDKVVEESAKHQNGANDSPDCLQAITDELEKANAKIKELEPLMKDYFSTSKKLSDSEKNVKELNEKLEEQSNTVIELETKVKESEKSLKEMSDHVEKRDGELEKVEEKREELECLNTGLKSMVDKATNDLQAKEIELQILSPKAAEKLQQSVDSDRKGEVESAKKTQSVIQSKDDDLAEVKSKLSKVKAACKAKDEFLKETKEKCNELEFAVDEKEIENQDMKKQLSDYSKKVEGLQFELNGKVEALARTGEELAILRVEFEKEKRLITEKEAENLQKSKDSDRAHEKGSVLLAESKDLTSKYEELQQMMTVVIEKNAEMEEQVANKEVMKNEIIQLEASIKSKNETISDMAKKLTVLEESDTEKKVSASIAQGNETSEINKLKEIVQEKNEEIAMFSQNLDALIEERESKDKNEEFLNNEIESLKKQLNEKALELKNKESQLKTSLEIDQSCSIDESFTEAKVENDFEDKVSFQQHLIKKLQKKLVSVSANKNEDLEVSMQDLESAVVDKEVELCEKDNIIEDKRKENEKLDKLIDEKIKENEILVEEKKQIEMELKRCNDQMSELEESLEEIKQKNKAETQSFKDAIEMKETEFKSQIHSEKTVNHKIKGDLQDALLEVENSRGDLERLKAEVTDKIDKINTLENCLNEKDVEIKSLEQEINSKSSSLNEVEAEKDEKQKLIDELKLNKEALKSAETEIKSQCDETERLKKEVDLKVEGLDKLEKDCKNQVSEIDRLTLDLNTRTSELSTAQQDLENKQVELDRERVQRAECDEMRDTIATLEQTVTDIRLRVEFKIKEMESLKNQLTKTQEMVSKLEAEIQEKENEIDKSNDCLRDRDIRIQELEEIQADKTQTDVDNNKIEILKNEIQNLKSENTGLNEKLKLQKDEISRTTASYKDEITALNLKLEDQHFTSVSLKEEIGELKKCKDVNSELHSQMTLKEVECETLKLELKVVNDNLSKQGGECSEIRLKLEELQKLYEAEQETVDKSEKVDTGCDKLNSDKLKEYERLYEMEKLKNEEYQKLLDETSEMNCLSPQKGVRKLRKEKIESDNALLEARFKNAALASKVNDLEKQLKCDSVSNRCGLSEVIPSHDPLLQRKLNHTTTKLHETEGKNRELIKEVSQLQSTVERLEVEIADLEKHDVPLEREIHRRSRASMLQADPRQSISSPSTKVELTRSRDREHTLREQLNKANSTIQEWLAKLSETENKLQQKTQELKHARDTIQNQEAHTTEKGRHTDKELQELLDRNNDLKLQILKKEGDVDAKSRIIEDLQRQLDTDIGGMKSYEKDKQEKDEMIALLKETLEELEGMLQEQEELMNGKEADLQSVQSDYKEILDKYHSLMETKDTKQQDLLTETRTAARTEAERDLLRDQVREADARVTQIEARATQAETKVKQTQHEKDKLASIIAENNQELKAMERSLTDAKRECEALRSQGADKHAEIHLEEVRRDMEKTVHDLQTKVRAQQCEMKEVNFKLSATTEKMKSVREEKLNCENKLKDFREERDKLVSGLEAVLKKKDVEIKQLKDMIKQLKEKEIEITKSWHAERDNLAVGVMSLQNHQVHIKTEKPDHDTTDSVPTSPTQHSSSHPAVSRHSSNGRPPRPAPPRVNSGSIPDIPVIEKTEIQTLERSPGSSRRVSGLTSSTATPANLEDSTTKRASDRRGKKRSSPVNTEHSQGPVCKRRSIESGCDSTLVSESDDYSTHRQLDATPAVAAKNLKKMRKKTGSNLDLSKSETVSPEAPTTGRRPTRNAKRSAKARILESFRESPMGKTSKRILDNIAETFSPKSQSPNKSPEKFPETEKSGKRSRHNSKENIPTSNVESTTEKKTKGRSTKSRHKLYKEDTYISDPFDNTGDFIQPSPDDIHQTVTRSLRSRRQ